MTLERSLPTIPQGPILQPLKPCFTGISPNPKGDMFTGVSGRVVNRNTYKVGDGHATMTTGRTLQKGSVSYCAFDWRYETPADLIQTGRNLVWQLQMDGSPIIALSTLAGSWSVVDRVGGATHRKVLGPIPWGRSIYVVGGAYLADSGGWVNLWYAVDGWPDVSKPPLFSRSGDTWQGRTGHHTIGQYSGHSKPGQYVGSFGHFGRAATPARAVELAR